MRKILFFFIFLNSLVAFCADTMKINVDAQSLQFKITLPANLTTGYQWTVKHYDKAFFKLITSQYIVPQTQRMGAGGNMVFIFSRIKDATYPKSTTMLFRYARSWERGGGSEKRVVINFK